MKVLFKRTCHLLIYLGKEYGAKLLVRKQRLCEGWMDAPSSRQNDAVTPHSPLIRISVL